MSAFQSAGPLPDRFPVTCPNCAAEAGMPAAVATVANHPHLLRVDFKCGNCDHSWSDEFASRPAADAQGLPDTVAKK